MLLLWPAPRFCCPRGLRCFFFFFFFVFAVPVPAASVAPLTSCSACCTSAAAAVPRLKIHTRELGPRLLPDIAPKLDQTPPSTTSPRCTGILHCAAHTGTRTHNLCGERLPRQPLHRALPCPLQVNSHIYTYNTHVFWCGLQDGVRGVTRRVLSHTHDRMCRAISPGGVEGEVSGVVY